jgi:hypothetical protein
MLSALSNASYLAPEGVLVDLLNTGHLVVFHGRLHRVGYELSDFIIACDHRERQ